jgi:hypothetical protein
MLDILMIKYLAYLMLLTGCATASGQVLPSIPPADKMIADEPIYCDGGVILYIHGFDTNPATKAGVVVVGVSSANHDHKAPFLVILLSDDGTATFYLSTDSGIQVMDSATWEARFGMGKNGACRARLVKTAL